MGVRPPVSVMLTLMGVAGLRMAVSPLMMNKGYPIRETSLLLPGVVVENFASPVIPVLRPMFDRVWNACGLMSSLNFSAQGDWAPRQW